MTKNKPHKKSKGGKTRKTRAKAKKLERNPKAFAPSSVVAAKKALVRAADLDQSKCHGTLLPNWYWTLISFLVPLLDKSGSDPAPYVVVVQGPRGVGKTTLIKCLVRHYTRQSLSKAEGPLTVVAGKTRRLTLIECPHDLNGMIDCSKVADLVLLVVDASFGFELETFEFLNLLQASSACWVSSEIFYVDSWISKGNGSPRPYGSIRFANDSE